MGSSAEDMKIDGADGFIKFALGENVKESNWGSFNTIRFPNKNGSRTSFLRCFIVEAMKMNGKNIIHYLHQKEEKLLHQEKI